MNNGELELLRDKCLFYTQFIIQKLSAKPESVKGLEETYRLIQNAYETKRIKPLRAISADIDDQVLRHMPLMIAVEFSKLINDRLKIDYEDVTNAYHTVIHRIVEDGKITNRQEYELALNRIDEIFSDETQSGELKALTELVTTYESDISG